MQLPGQFHYALSWGSEYSHTEHRFRLHKSADYGAALDYLKYEHVQQHGYDSYEDLKKARDELSAKMSDARNTAKSTDADLKLLNERIHYLGQYLSTKAAYKAFLQAGNKKMYRSAHQDEIARYEEAIQFLKRNSTDGTIPTMKNLRAEKEKLLSARTAQYESYTYFKDYYHELQTACRNVDIILEMEHTQQHSRTQPKRSHKPSL